MRMRARVRLKMKTRTVFLLSLLPKSPRMAEY
jgi:hypothetical protein